jgi:hypothetical protein
MGYNGKMPQSMTVEIIKKHKGIVIRQKIKIWGNNEILCRPYILNFVIGDYFLIAPESIEETGSSYESTTDYNFFSCSTDYLNVDMKTKNALRKYTNYQDKISLDEFEKTMQ